MSKLCWCMEFGGCVWCGYFFFGGELIFNCLDWKEGLYLGSELDVEYFEVCVGMLLYGVNLFFEVFGLCEMLLEYLDVIICVGYWLMEGIVFGLGLEVDYFVVCYIGDLLIFFCLFNYLS